MTEDQLVKAVSKIIAQRADFFKQIRKGLPQPLAIRLNNPGLLKSHFNDGRPNPFYENLPSEFGYVEFETVNAGWKALHSYVRNRVVRHRCFAWQLFPGDQEGLEMLTRALSVSPQQPVIDLVKGGRPWPMQTRKRNTGSTNLTNLRSANG